MLLHNFRYDRKSGVALMFAIMAVPITGLVGLAVDFGMWNETYATLSLAASSAALNAAKTAASADLNNDANYLAEGTTAGKQWFMAGIGRGAYAAYLPTITPTVSVTVSGTTIVANISFTGNVASIFGKLFHKASYAINVSASAVMPIASYLNVEILLDNSPSMEIGATPGDIAAMMYLTPCSMPGAIYGVQANQTSGGSSPSGQNYNNYTCNSGNIYDGQLPQYGEQSCPIPLPFGVNGSGWLTPTAYVGGPNCTNLAKQTVSPVSGQYPLAGAPCAFACHFDSADPLSKNNDYFGVARSTIGRTPCYQAGAAASNCAITLRFALVKTAVNQVITAIQSYNVSALNNLNVGVFTFDISVNQIYPPPATCGVQGSLVCQAGGDWTTALSDVGTPPTQANTPDSGIQPYTGSNGGDTNLPNVLTSLAANYLTVAGDGSSPTKPLKVLFLVTDGMADYNNGATRLNVAIDPSQCQTYKNMGYTVYVLYTPYYPLMNAFYLSKNYSIAEGTGAGSLVYNLQQCASDPVNDFIEADATDTTSIARALQTFLKRALNAPARFTL
jgi:Flp pilus assembly protein TadG